MYKAFIHIYKFSIVKVVDTNILFKEPAPSTSAGSGKPTYSAGESDPVPGPSNYYPADNPVPGPSNAGNERPKSSTYNLSEVSIL